MYTSVLLQVDRQKNDFNLLPKINLKWLSNKIWLDSFIIKLSRSETLEVLWFMPNNCSSIFKLILCVYLIFSFSSCANINQIESQTKIYNAKVKIFNDSNIYKSNIIVFKDNIIIQFNEFFLGNVSKLELSSNGSIKSNILLNNERDKYLDELSENFSSKYFVLFYRCLMLDDINYEDKIVKIICDKYGRILFTLIEYQQDINIKLLVSRKIERAKKTPTEIK